MLRKLKEFFTDTEAGQGLVEYALILVLVAMVVIVILALFGPFIAAEYAVATEAVHCGGQLAELEPAANEIAVRGTSFGQGSPACIAVDREEFKAYVRDQLTPD